MKLPYPHLAFLLFIGSLLLTACESPGYNDNPSQQMTKATVGCLVATDFFAVYFSAYIKPANDSNTKMTVKDRKALFRSYCKNIPTTGTAFFTADVVGDELRQTPIGIRIVEQELTGGDEDKAENFKDIRTIAEIPAKLYPRGAVEAQAQLDKNGYYAIYLMVGGEEALSDEDKLRIPLHVGVDPDANPIRTYIAIGIGGTVGLALIGFVAYRFMRRQNSQ
ncbi:hypothetical protein MGMO_91c00030 [Methyloglobulus morosus KoM1]|uniref:Lipoprotein n=1 Tax=Methyloglobulus morosus KoM1 TaxID=1116472 RepID=V5BZT3_9GAMM|nr:hypothetical protein [Methyloglobulus morosus]ESS71752.1 hypothetical protein MGMO_91c00030 [Methyloglobulus morosus KoM1]